MPKPESNESHGDFIDRCMSDQAEIDLRPDTDARLARCEGIWESEKAMEPIDIIQSLPNRKSADRFGIGTADRYFREIEQCYNGGFCPTKIFGQATQEQWADALNKASSKLVYCDRDMQVLDTRRKGPAGSTPGACLDFDCVVTSTRQDRDGDILESSGAILDPSAPLLWQHMPFNPLGKVVAELRRTRKKLHVRNAIIDNQEGNDAAQLIEFGALRISHGFRPIKFEPLEGKKGSDEDPQGWHIHEFEIMEVSLVSIPSNVDAVITAFSRGKLHSPMIKGWAQAAFNNRPVQGVGMEVKATQPDPPIPYVGYSHSERIESGDTQHEMSWTAPTRQGLKDIVQESLKEPEEIQPEKHHVPKTAKSLITFDDLRETESDTIRWNKSASKHFDVALEHLEPSNLEYDWVSRYCGCEIKKLFNITHPVPSIKMGSFLTGLRYALAKYNSEDIRNITYQGREIPPVNEFIQLNSKSSENFLVHGIEFLKGKCCLVVKREPRWYGMDITIYSARKHEDDAMNVMMDASKWAQENNFLKNEAFSLSGEFLPATNEKWDDLFLTTQNETALKKAVGAINSKGGQCPNRGMGLLGPPGTGKTLSGRIVKNLTDASFIWISARDFYRMGAFGGLSYGFDLARELAPSILFIEDVDNWLDSRTLDLLKTEMDGIARSTGVITMLTTNYPERLPEALLDRPGRFHDVLKFDLPNTAIRKTMIAKWLGDISGLKLEKVIEKTDGYSGAHIRELANFAQSLADDDGISMADAVMKAIDKLEEQRELINETQLAGSNYKPTRSFTGAITAKEYRNMFLKRGRTLSAKNEDSLKEAVEDLEEANKIKDVPRAAKTLVRSASSRIKAVLKQLASANEDDDDSGKQGINNQIESMTVTQMIDLQGQLSHLINEKEAGVVLELLGI